MSGIIKGTEIVVADPLGVLIKGFEDAEAAGEKLLTGLHAILSASKDLVNVVPLNNSADIKAFKTELTKGNATLKATATAEKEKHEMHPRPGKSSWHRARNRLPGK